MFLKDFVSINPKTELVKNEKYGFVEMADLVIGNKHVSPSQERIYKSGGSRFQNGDTLFARITPCLENGKIAQYRSEKWKESFGSTEFIVLRNKEGISIQDFVYYLALSDIVRKPAEKSMFGASGRQRVDIEVFGNIEIPHYALEDQEKIVGILSLFDELIEINSRRIEILEEIVQSLYNEWFVHYRYSTNATVGTSQPRQEELPKRWEICSASDAMIIDPKLAVKKNIEKKYVPMSSLSTNSMVIENIEKRKNSSGSKFQNGDTLFARITPCLENGKIGYVQFLSGDEIGIGSTEFIVLRSKTLTPEFVYCLARSDRFRAHAIKSMAGASGRQRVRKECFTSFYFAHPPNSVLSIFSKETSPMFEEIQLLVSRNRILKEIRDLLLPRLISGLIDVGDLNKNSWSD